MIKLMCLPNTTNIFSTNSITILVILYLTFTTLPALAACPYTPIISDPILEPWRWRNFPELQGRIIECMTEAKDSSIWFGLNNGVARYDGVNWSYYTPKDGIVGRHVTALYAARDGSVYAGTEVGISRFVNGRWRPFFPLFRNLTFKVHQIRQFTDGSIWAGMAGGAVCVKGDSVTIYSIKSVLHQILQIRSSVTVIELPILTREKSFTVFDVYQDQSGAIWFLSSTGSYIRGKSQVIRYEYKYNRPEDPKSWTMFIDIDGVEAGYDSRMIQRQDSVIWTICRSSHKGVNQFDGKKWKNFSLHAIGGNDRNYSIFETQDGSLWIACQGKLCRYKDKTWRVYQYPDVMIPSSSYQLLQTRDGTLWIAGRNGEVNSVDYRNNCWLTFDGLHFQCETPDGLKWFLSEKGNVVSFDGTHWQEYDRQDGLIDTPVALVTSINGMLWAAGSHQRTAAVAYYNNGRWKRFLHHTLSWTIDHRSIFAAADSSVWFGASSDPFLDQGYQGGMVRYQSLGSDRITYRHIKPPQVHKNAIGIAQSKDGVLWFGGEVITCFDGLNYFQVPSLSHLKYQVIDNLYSTKNGHVWASDLEGGLFHYNGETWKKYLEKDGIASNMITCLSSGGDERVWAATPKGVSRFDGSAWVSLALPSGIAINKECGTIRHTSDGHVWINLTYGEWYKRALLGSDLKSLKFNFKTIRYMLDTRPPETEIVVSQEKVSHPGNVIISWSGRDGWNATAKDRLYYSSRIDNGLWSPFSKETTHIFFRLKPGYHLFEVRARDQDLNIDPTPAQLRFSVIPPIWRQTWFITLMAVLLSIIVYLEVRVIRRDIKLRREARYRSVIEDQSELICRFLPNGTLTFVNLSFWRFFGSDRDTMLGQNLKEFIPKDEIDVIWQHLGELTAAKPTVNHDRFVPLQNGAYQWQQWIYRAIYDKRGHFVEYQAVGHDITERVLSEKRLKEFNKRLRSLSKYLKQVKEEEATRISREIHDQLGQLLTGLSMNLYWADEWTKGTDEALEERIQKMIYIVDQAIETVHGISQKLRPKVLDDLGLTAAVEWQLDEFQKLTGIKVEAALDLETTDIIHDAAIDIFRVVQEALTNITRHAQASHVDVYLSREDSRLVLKISDNGKGITKKEIIKSNAFGILSMQERIYEWGGNMDIKGRKGKGTTIIVHIPIENIVSAEEVNDPR